MTKETHLAVLRPQPGRIEVRSVRVHTAPAPGGVTLHAIALAMAGGTALEPLASGLSVTENESRSAVVEAGIESPFPAQPLRRVAIPAKRLGVVTRGTLDRGAEARRVVLLKEVPRVEAPGDRGAAEYRLGTAVTGGAHPLRVADLAARGGGRAFSPMLFDEPGRAEWVNYHSSDTQPKPYTCGSCHTTGWQDITENGGVNQDGRVGILGTWEETGIRCEECHGPGVVASAAGGGHVISQEADEITVDRSAELCGNCHFRDINHNILASGGYIRHHEQYDELIRGAKSFLNCTDCHDPHIGTRYNNPGIVQTCEDCHANVPLNHSAPVDCEFCHMPRASKSARAVHAYEADVRTHIFKIDTRPFPKDSMFFVDPDDGNTYARGAVTLDFACYQCHTDPVTLEGGGGSQRTLAELSAAAAGIHN